MLCTSIISYHCLLYSISLFQYSVTSTPYLRFNKQQLRSSHTCWIAQARPQCWKPLRQILGVGDGLGHYSHRTVLNTDRRLFCFAIFCKILFMNQLMCVGIYKQQKLVKFLYFSFFSILSSESHTVQFILLKLQYFEKKKTPVPHKKKSSILLTPALLRNNVLIL